MGLFFLTSDVLEVFRHACLEVLGFNCMRLFLLVTWLLCFGVVALLHTDSVLGVSLSGSRFGCCSEAKHRAFLLARHPLVDEGYPVRRVCFPASISYDFGSLFGLPCCREK